MLGLGDGNQGDAATEGDKAVKIAAGVAFDLSVPARRGRPAVVGGTITLPAPQGQVLDAQR